MDICVCVCCVLFVFIAISIGLLLMAAHDDPETVKLAGAAWPCDICKCFGVLTAFWWEEVIENITIVCIKVGYASRRTEWIKRTATNGNTYSSPEFYHTGIADRFKDGGNPGFWIWVFNKCGASIPQGYTNGIRKGSAGLAEVALRCCMFYSMTHGRHIPLNTIHYGSDEGDRYPSGIFTGIWPSPKQGSGEFVVVSAPTGSDTLQAIRTALNEACAFMDGLFVPWGAGECPNDDTQLENIKATSYNWWQRAEVYSCASEALYEKSIYIAQHFDCISKEEAPCRKADYPDKRA